MLTIAKQCPGNSNKNLHFSNLNADSDWQIAAANGSAARGTKQYHKQMLRLAPRGSASHVLLCQISLPQS